MLKWEHIAVDYQNLISCELKYFSQGLVATWKQFHFQTGVLGKGTTPMQSSGPRPSSNGKEHAMVFPSASPSYHTLRSAWHPKTEPHHPQAGIFTHEPNVKVQLLSGPFSNNLLAGKTWVHAENLAYWLTKLEIIWHP